MRRAPNPVSLISCAIPIVALAILGWQQRWFSDDGWINMRVVEQVLAGNGPVYNAGERVEVTTSTLWFWILLAGAVVGPRSAPEVTGAVLGLTLTVAGLVFATLGAGLLARARRPLAVLPFGTPVLAALPPMWDFATSGLETGLSFAWLGLCFWLLALRAVSFEGGTRHAAWWPVWPALAIGLGPLVRPDFTLYAALFAAALLLMSRFRLLDWLACFGIAIAIPGAYQVFRMGFYASLVPNTALAKDAADSRWGSGIAYLVDYLGLYLLAIPLVITLIVIGAHVVYARGRGSRARWVVVSAPVVGALLHGLYIVRIGGDFMHARFLLPDTFALLLPVAVIGFRPVRRGLRVAAVTLMAAWAVLIGALVRTPYAMSAGGLADERKFWSRAAQHPQILLRDDWARTDQHRDGREMRAHYAAGHTFYQSLDARDGRKVGPRLPTATGEGIYVAHPNLGILSIAAGVEVHVVDVHALGDAVTARAELEPDPSRQVRTGHLTRPEAWRLARYTAPQTVEPHTVADARAALRCGDLGVLQEAITADLAPDQVLDQCEAGAPTDVLDVPGRPCGGSSRTLPLSIGGSRITDFAKHEARAIFLSAGESRWARNQIRNQAP